MKAAAETLEMPLFPLQTVLFPDGLLPLKIFEARYLDLMGRCLREQRPFGVVTLRAGGEVLHKQNSLEIAQMGCSAHLVEVDSPQPNILMVRCRGGERFHVLDHHRADSGLWMARVRMIEADPVLPPQASLHACVDKLIEAVDALQARGIQPFLEPLRYDDAGWVANRWCEILPIPMHLRLQLLALGDPALRLARVDEYLREQGILDRVL